MLKNQQILLIWPIKSLNSLLICWVLGPENLLIPLFFLDDRCMKLHTSTCLPTAILAYKPVVGMKINLVKTHQRITHPHPFPPSILCVWMCECVLVIGAWWPCWGTWDGMCNMCLSVDNLHYWFWYIDAFSVPTCQFHNWLFMTFSFSLKHHSLRLLVDYQSKQNQLGPKHIQVPIERNQNL